MLDHRVEAVIRLLDRHYPVLPGRLSGFHGIAGFLSDVVATHAFPPVATYMPSSFQSWQAILHQHLAPAPSRRSARPGLSDPETQYHNSHTASALKLRKYAVRIVNYPTGLRGHWAECRVGEWGGCTARQPWKWTRSSMRRAATTPPRRSPS